MHIRWSLLFTFMITFSSSFDVFALTDAQGRVLTHEQYKSAYGNKTYNLAILQDIINTLPAREQQKYAVPAFIGISNEYIKNLLAICEYDRPAYPQKTRFIIPQTRTPRIPFLSVIESNWPDCVRMGATARFLSKEIADYFCVYPELHVKSKQELPLYLKNFFELASVKRLLLMVRSTGAEDTKDLANAGGNESIACVKPEMPSVFDAVGQVVASYFSEKSIKQRILAGDPTINEMPSTPVLLQVMIGEDRTYAATMPVSGVMFSQEAEANTPSITQIQATYGHNEAVVNSLVPVDTYYVRGTTIHPVIRHKHERLAPGADNKLERVANEKSSHDKPCLTKQNILDLKALADASQKFYGYPVDIEFVVQNGVIYLIQARPIVAQPQKPSYIPRGSVVGKDTMEATAITVAGGAVVTINNAQEILIADTIGTALDEFLNKSNQQQIKAVIVGAMAPATSHEATTFRCSGKPVMCVCDVRALQDKITHGAAPLHIDTQQGFILFNAQAQINSGWAVHPIPKLISLVPEYINYNSGKKFLIDLTHMQEHFSGVATEQLFAIMRASNESRAICAASSLLFRMHTLIQKAKQDLAGLAVTKTIIQYYIVQLEQLFEHLLTVVQEFDFARDGQRIEWLYAVNFMEALYNQAPDSQIVRNYSFKALADRYQEEKDLANVVRVRNPKLVQFAISYAKLGAFTLSQDVRDHWLTFISWYGSMNDNQAAINSDFAAMVRDYTALGLAPLWINTAAYEGYKRHLAPYEPHVTRIGPDSGVSYSNNAHAMARELLADYQRSKSLFEQLQDKKRTLETMDIDRWQQPTLFEKQMDQLNLLVSYFTGSAFANAFSNGTRIAQGAALTVMNQFVDVFDRSIKSLKGSTLYAKNAKIANMRTMLNRYLKVLQHWAQDIVGMSVVDKLVDDNHFANPKARNYFDEISTILNRGWANHDMLMPSPQFNVAAACLGSKANWLRSIGYDVNNVTPEDIFTLIHQNLLVMLAKLNAQVNNGVLAVPPLVQRAQRSLEQISVYIDAGNGMGYQTMRPQLVGLQLDTSGLRYLYNLALRNHSSTFTINFNKGQLSLTATYLGEARDRWHNIAQAVERFVKGENTSWFSRKQDPMPVLLEAPRVDSTRGKVSFTIGMADEKQIQSVIDFINKITRDYAV